MAQSFGSPARFAKFAQGKQSCFLCFIVSFFLLQKFGYVMTVAKQRILNSLAKHEKAVQDATNGGFLKLLHAIDKMKLTVILFQAQFELAYSLLDLYRQPDILIAFQQTVLHFEDFMTFLITYHVNNTESFLDVFNAFEENFSFQQVLDKALSLLLLLVPFLENFSDLASPYLFYLMLNILKTHQFLFFMRSLDLGKYIIQHLIFVLVCKLFPKYLLANFENDRKLFLLLRRNFDLETIGDSMALLADLIHKIFKLFIGIFCRFISAHEFSIKVRVLFQAHLLSKEIDFCRFYGVEISKGDIFKISLLEKLISFSLTLEEYFHQQSFGNIGQFCLNIGNGSIVLKRVLMNILYENLWQDVEVLFVLCMQLFDKMVDCIDMLEIKPILLQKLQNLQYFSFHYFVRVYWLLVLIQLLEGCIIVLKMVFKLLGHNTILSPDLALSIELVNSILQEALVRFAKIVVVGGKNFLGSSHSIEGLTVVVNLQVAYPHVSQSKGVG